MAIRIRTLLEEESKLQQFPEGNRSVLSPLIPDPAPVTCPSVCPSMQDCENPLPRFLFSNPLHFPTWKEHKFRSIQQNLISKYHVKAYFAVIDANNDINNTSATQTHWQWILLILSDVSNWPIMIGRSAHYGSARPTMNDRSRHYPSDNDHRAVTGRLPISHALHSFQPTHTHNTLAHTLKPTHTQSVNWGIGNIANCQHEEDGVWEKEAGVVITPHPPDNRCQ